MRLYGQIQKIEDVEDGTIRVHGIASTEDTDDQGEIVRGDAMRDAIPGYMRFPALREMHQLLAAGTTLEVDVGTDNITRLVAHVVDPVAISKVKNQVYRGFSIGGRVTKRDHIDSKIITGIQLNEISLVDRPANPGAVLDCWKARASEGEHSMTNGLGTLADTEAGKKLAELQPVQVWTCGNPEHQHVAKTDAVKCLEQNTAGDEPKPSETAPVTLEEVAKRAEEGANAAQDVLLEAQRAIERGEVTLVDAPAVDEPTEKSGSVDNAPAQPNPNSGDVLSTAAIEKGGDAPGDGSKPYGDVQYADPGHLADGKKRYPIDTEAHIRSAWSYINKPANCAKYSGGDCAKVKAKIVAAWKDKIDSDGPPSAGKKASRVIMTKSLYDVGELAMLVQQLWRMQERLEYEASVEGDESSAPAKAHEACSLLCEFLNELVAEETAEILDGEEIDEPLGMDMGPVALSAIAGSLRKSIVDKDKVERLVSTLHKAGARHNAMDQMHLDRAANNTAAAMNMDGCTKADMIHLGDAHKALLDSGATAHAHPTVSDGGGEDSLPSGGATENATVDTGHNAEHSAPTRGTMVPKASDMSLMFDALGKAGAIPGSEELVAEADAFYKAGAKPHQVLANLAHGHVAAACDGATCKQDAAKPARHSGETMAHLHKAHFNLTRCSGAMKCDAAAALIPGGEPNADGEPEGQGTSTTAGGRGGEKGTAGKDAAVEGGDLVKATIALTQMVTKLADQLEVKTSEVADLKQAAASHEKRLDVVENQPVPPKTAASGTVAISKQQDGGRSGSDASEISDVDIAKRWQAMTPDERTLALIKGAHVTSPIAIRGFTDGPVPQNPRAPEPQT